jgi:uncharacterized protein YjbJ (UPF0337 family)
VTPIGRRGFGSTECGKSRSTTRKVKRRYSGDDEMEGEFAKAKGKVKQAAGDLTDNDDLKREGKADEASGKIKEKLEDAKDWVEDKVDDVKDKLKRD